MSNQGRLSLPRGEGGTDEPNPRHLCSYSKLEFHLPLPESMASVFACWGCGEYHVCDGSSECTLIETHEGVVCALTGNYMGPHFQPALRPWTEIRQDTQDQRDKWEPEQVQGLVQTVVNHLYHYFLNENVISGVSEALFDQDGALRPHIPALVSFVFPCCLMLFRGASSEKVVDVVLSLYIHVIISIYSQKTVYGALLFKSTRNKRYDAVAKRMRELWMSTLTTKC
uniref:BDLF4 n=1 Tax=Epstein-Barr virus (strain GD1) TaxID=10376 RepID=A0A3R5X4Y4_EBVG|nr:BDLF4 [human gammaherpesvirus 4]